MTCSGGRSGLVRAISCNWLLTAYAAAVGLIIGKPLGVRANIPGLTPHAIVAVFCIVAFLGTTAKVLGIFGISAAEGSTIGRELAEKDIAAGRHLDLEIFAAGFVSATPWPMKAVIKWSLHHAAREDLLAAPKFFLRVLQMQAVSKIG